MKLAITVWNDRVAPVFDVAQRCILRNTETGVSEEKEIPDVSIEEKAKFFEYHGVTTVICGAISREYEEAVVAKNIEVVSFIAGSIDEVIEAWNEKQLIQTSFSMPGCGCPRWRFRRRGCHTNHNLNL